MYGYRVIVLASMQGTEGTFPIEDLSSMQLHKDGLLLSLQKGTCKQNQNKKCSGKVNPITFEQRIGLSVQCSPRTPRVPGSIPDLAVSLQFGFMLKTEAKDPGALPK